MIVLLPLLWIVGWLIAALTIGAFSGLAPKGAGLELFLIIFLGGGFALPVLGALGWYLWRRIRDR